MGGRGSASAKANGKNSKIGGDSASEVANGGANGGGGGTSTSTSNKINNPKINRQVEDLRDGMERAPVGTTYKYRPTDYDDPNVSDVVDIFEKVSEKDWMLIHNYRDKFGNKHSVPDPKLVTAEDLWRYEYTNKPYTKKDLDKYKYDPYTDRYK